MKQGGGGAALLLTGCAESSDKCMWLLLTDEFYFMQFTDDLKELGL